MASYYDISDPYTKEIDDLEAELSRLIEVLQAPPRLVTLLPAVIRAPAPPPTRARKPGKGCGADKERLAISLAGSQVSAVDVTGKITDSTRFGAAKANTTHVPSQTPSIAPSVAEYTGRTVRVA